LEAFIRGGESPFYLIIMLDDLKSELAQGLVADAGHPEGDGLAFRTVGSDLDAALTGDVGRLVRKRRMEADDTVAHESVPPELLSSACFIAPICKRSEVSFLTHVSVGRARHHDIVLRHQSISKFHAWFEVADQSTLYLKDCNSRNHTYINGLQMADRGRVSSGDILKFGAVECFASSATDLWRAIHR
jgi:hypothetical protein